jgi:hypothetical protein
VRGAAGTPLSRRWHGLTRADTGSTCAGTRHADV